MRPDAREAIPHALPAVTDIENDDLREAVIDAWAMALEDTGWALGRIPWFPPVQDDLDLPDETLLDHVNDVVAAADALARTLVERRDAPVDRDVVLAGALVHDVSKLYEFDRDGATPTFDLLGHPHYGVHVAARAGLPVAVQHVVLSHTHRTSVDPATIEAAIVRRADEVAAAAIRDQTLDDLRDA